MQKNLECALLEMSGIEKSFLGVKALKNVNFVLRAGEVHALMGENGAGKSTLMKILAGEYLRDSGVIKLNGAEVLAKTPIEAQRMGISIVNQELNLLPHLTVFENITIGRECKHFGLIDRDACRKRAERLFHTEIGLKIDPESTLSSLNAACKQMVAIARAIDTDAKVLIMDEPTSSLDKEEVKVLFTLLEKLKNKGIGIVYISHKMEEIFAVADRITVLRDGCFINSYKSCETDKVRLVCDMVGKDWTERKGEHKDNNKHNSGLPICSLAAVATNGTGVKLEDISLTVREGEIVGLSGLLGSGRTETAKVIFGMAKLCAGKGELFAEHLPNSAIEAVRREVGFLPEERRQEGIFPNMNIRENLTMPFLKQLSKWWIIDKSKEKSLVDEYMKKLVIKASSFEQEIKNLSGGNQQKVILARWLAAQSKLLILDEPTRGIDIGAKQEIELLMRQCAEEGKSILLISSEMEELVRNSEKVYVLVDGKTVAELSGEEITEKRIINEIASFHRHSEVIV